MKLAYLEKLYSKTIDEALSLLTKLWIRPKYFEHFNAKTIEQAVSLLDYYSGEAKIMAGGVDLIRLMKSKVVAPKVIVNIKTITDLAYIREDAEGLKLGSLTTISGIEKSALIRDRYVILAQAAHLVASPQIRNMASIGGNLCQDVNCWYYRRSPLTGTSFSCYRKGGIGCPAIDGDNRYHAIMGGSGCYAVCSSDMAPALIALEAKVKIASPDGEKTIPLEELYTPLCNPLNHNELITEIQIPTPRPSTKQIYLKFSLRKAIDPALSSVAAAITAEAGRVADARIVLGAVAPTPYRSLEAEGVIKGKAITENLAETAAKAAVSQATPLSMNAYKISITEALVKRVILA
jgi:xanthine dehydrogenase YagS FAD-binding subunit